MLTAKRHPLCLLSPDLRVAIFKKQLKCKWVTVIFPVCLIAQVQSWNKDQQFSIRSNLQQLALHLDYERTEIESKQQRELFSQIWVACNISFMHINIARKTQLSAKNTCIQSLKVLKWQGPLQFYLWWSTLLY